MYCPKCSQPQGSDTIRFCSRCGLPLLVVRELVSHEGALPGRETGAVQSMLRRREGMRRGARLTLAGLTLTPAGYGLCFLVHSGVPVIIPVTLFLIGLAWIFYARIFGEDLVPLSPGEGSPRISFGPTHRDTKRPEEPFAVTEHTTQLFS